MKNICIPFLKKKNILYWVRLHKVLCEKVWESQMPSIPQIPKNTIPIDELVDENFEESCILKLFHTYLGSTKSLTLSVEEILVKKMNTWNHTLMESQIVKSQIAKKMSNESLRIHYILTRDHSR